jgi:hypothetical protein
MVRAIVLQIFHGIPEGNTTVVQEAMDVHTGFIAEQPAYLGLT